MALRNQSAWITWFVKVHGAFPNRLLSTRRLPSVLPLFSIVSLDQLRWLKQDQILPHTATMLMMILSIVVRVSHSSSLSSTSTGSISRLTTGPRSVLKDDGTLVEAHTSELISSSPQYAIKDSVASSRCANYFFIAVRGSIFPLGM